MDGLIVIDKPTDLTSHDVVARVRHILHVRRIGHTGTLDPFATGVQTLSASLERVRQRTDYKKTWSRWTITYRAVDTLLANTSLIEEQQIVAGEPWRWAAESYAITLDPAVRYCVEVGNSCNYSATSLLKPHDKRLEQLNQSYLTQFSARAEDRVRKAGFRLAHLLNQALDPAYQGPVQDGLQQP